MRMTSDGVKAAGQAWGKNGPAIAWQTPGLLTGVLPRPQLVPTVYGTEQGTLYGTKEDVFSVSPGPDGTQITVRPPLAPKCRSLRETWLDLRRRAIGEPQGSLARNVLDAIAEDLARRSEASGCYVSAVDSFSYQEGQSFGRFGTVVVPPAGFGAIRAAGQVATGTSPTASQTVIGLAMLGGAGALGYYLGKRSKKSRR